MLCGLGEIIKALLQRKRCLEYSLQAQHYANTIQDFNREYEEVIVQNCSNC